MLTDIIIILYILMLFPFLYECEKLQSKGLRYLIIGVIFTPIVGYFALRTYKQRNLKNSD